MIEVLKESICKVVVDSFLLVSIFVSDVVRKTALMAHYVELLHRKKRISRNMSTAILPMSQVDKDCGLA